MNRARRSMIAEAVELLTQLQADIQSVRDEEDDAFNNLPESLQDGERGQAMAEAVGQMDDAISGLEDAIASLIEAAA